MSQMLDLLDDTTVTGLYGVRREISPTWTARVVDRDDLGDALQAVEQTCQAWGGGCGPLLPMRRDADRFSAHWEQYANRLEVDFLATRQIPGKNAVLANDSAAARVTESGWIDPVLLIFSSQERGPEAWRPVRVPRLAIDDPWCIAYAGVLGRWPDAPDAATLRTARFRPDVDFSEIITTAYDDAVDPSGLDLLGRLRDPQSIPPVLATLALLGRRESVDTTQRGSDGVLPRSDDVARQYGSNLVVIYEPGSVEDLCLLWNLRAAHGLWEMLPLGVPVTSDVPAIVREWTDKGTVQSRFLGETKCALISCSVERARLDDLARACSVTQAWDVVDADQVLLPPRRPARTSTDLATFATGTTTIAAWSSSDREFLRFPPGSGSLRLRVHVELERRRLPASRTLHDAPPIPVFRSGGFELQQSEDRLIDISWPDGWTVLDAVVRDRGFVARRSVPGQAAAALLRRLGNVGELDPLLHQGVLAKLDYLGERQGISWFRRELRRILQAASEDDLPAGIERELAQLRTRPSGDDAYDVGHSQMSQILGGGAKATTWLNWAENRGLLVRGVQVTCHRCGAKSWRTTDELAPPIICRGCGDAIVQPFPAHGLTFRYRAAEPLLRVLEHDALPHLLALRYFIHLFHEAFDRPDRLYGGYPGVDIVDPATGKQVGEADVLLLFTNGDLVLGECKRRPAGLTDSELADFDEFAARIGAAWSFVATPQPASECGPIWRAAERGLPTPRFALTGEQLLDSPVFWSLGTNPLVWRQEDQQSWTNREQGMLNALPETIKWLDDRRQGVVSWLGSG